MVLFLQGTIDERKLNLLVRLSVRNSKAEEMSQVNSGFVLRTQAEYFRRQKRQQIDGESQFHTQNINHSLTHLRRRYL